MNSYTQSKKTKFLTNREICLFAMFGALMYASKVIMEVFPNIHIIGMFTMTFTIVYRRKALFPIYTFVLLTGIFNGFQMWWIPYLYLWTILWAITMLIPRKIPDKFAAIVYPIVCGLHGLSYGTLYAPVQAIMFGFNFDTTIKWIIAGLPWDIIHGLGNLAAGLLVLPLSKLLKRLN